MFSGELHLIEVIALENREFTLSNRFERNLR